MSRHVVAVLIASLIAPPLPRRRRDNRHRSAAEALACRAMAAGIPLGSRDRRADEEGRRMTATLMSRQRTTPLS